MLKVKNKRMLMKKGAALVLASVLFVSSSKVAYADGTESYISSIEEGLKANDFSKVTNNILKDIVNTTNSKIALSDIDIALKSDSNNDHFIAQGILVNKHICRGKELIFPVKLSKTLISSIS